jgi:hypothetical protein
VTPAETPEQTPPPAEPNEKPDVSMRGRYRHGSIDNWRQWLVFIGVLLAAVCAALVLHYVLIRILRSLARRSTSKLADLLIRHLRRPVLWVMILIAVGLAAEFSMLASPVNDFAITSLPSR